MVSKILIALCIVTIVAAVPSPGTWADWRSAVESNFLPPWISSAPWYPQWTPCTTVGISCIDCSTKLVCTKIGGLQRACTDPARPHCNFGVCAATPSDECSVPEPEPGPKPEPEPVAVPEPKPKPEPKPETDNAA